MLEPLWNFLVRFRTYVVNLAGAVMIVLPDILSAPEVLAVIPPSYQKYIIVSVFLLNIWMRPRPATRAADPEVQAKRAIKAADGPTIVSVKEAGKSPVVVGVTK